MRDRQTQALFKLLRYRSAARILWRIFSAARRCRDQGPTGEGSSHPI